MDYEFKSLNELYNRIKPALKARCNELRLLGKSDIREIDIWNCLTDKKWKTSHDLDLSSMVNDIFNISKEEIIDYLIKDL